MRKILGLALFLMSAITAHATDLANKAPVAAPTVATWSGLYAGVGAGYSFGDISGASLGARAGYDWQSGKGVFGVESDLSWSNISGNADVTNLGIDGDGHPHNKTTASGSTGTNWWGSTNLRAGYLPTYDLLVYALGGLAYGNRSLDAAVTAGPFTGVISDTRTGLGWDAGLGAEYRITTSWSALLEARWVSLGAINDSFPVGNKGVGTASMPSGFGLFTVGANYHF